MNVFPKPTLECMIWTYKCEKNSTAIYSVSEYVPVVSFETQENNETWILQKFTAWESGLYINE